MCCSLFVCVCGDIKGQPLPPPLALQLGVSAEPNVDAYVLDSRRARKNSVQPHTLHKGLLLKPRSKKPNKIFSNASQKVDTLKLNKQGHPNHEDSRDTAVGLVALLKACAQQKDVHTGAKIHVDVSRNGLLKSNVFIGTALVNLYAKCGALEKAQEVFDELLVRNEVSWTALIVGYAHFGHIEEALCCLKQMQDEGFRPNAIVFPSILKSCGISRNLNKGQELHTHILREHLFVDHIEVGNALVDMYAKCGAMQRAQDVFDELPVHDIVSWNALITAYTHNGRSKEALDCFDWMQQVGFSPNAVTFICVLKACGSLGACDKGEAIHSLITKENLLETHSEVANALVDMYVKCGALEKAQDVVNQVPVCTVVLWTTLISGYAQQGSGIEALHVFDRMQSEGLSPDAFTFACTLKACANLKALKRGQQIHAQIQSMHLPEKDSVVASALLDMYAKCGLLQNAQKVFDELRARGVFVWNTLISAHAHHDLVEETWSLFKQMQCEGLSPDEVTFACVLKACSNSGAAHKGERIHAEILRHGLHERGAICVALVNMYASCGLLQKAHELCYKLQFCDSLVWGTLMVGYSQLGESQIVLHLFDIMIAEGREPEPVIFTILLNACSHVGLLNEGQLYFEFMVHAFSVIPSLEHLTCMVSLFGNAGYLDEALAVIERMPFPVDLTIWHTLLVICQKLGSVKLARWAFKHAVQLNEEDAAAYVFTSNMFVDVGRLGVECKVKAVESVGS